MITHPHQAVERPSLRLQVSDPSADLPEKVVWPALVGLTLLALVLRLFQLDNGLWYDEIRTLVDSVRTPLGDIVTHFPGNNDHTLYSVLAHLSIAAFGEHGWSLRLPVVVFGVAAIPMLHVLGAQVTSRRESLAAAGLLAVSYHHIWFSQNARGYTMLLFLTLLATYFLLRGMKEEKRSYYIGFAVASALGAYTHLTMVFVVGGQALIVAWCLLRTRAYRDWHRLINPALAFGLAAALTVLLYAPMLLQMYRYVGQESLSVAGIATPRWALAETLRQLGIGFGTGTAGIAVLVLLALGCWSYLRQNPVVLLLFMMPVPLTLMAALVLHHPVRPRFFFFIAGFALLIVVRGAVVLTEWILHRFAPSPERGPAGAWAPFIPIAAMALASILALPSAYRYPKQDYAEALRYVEANAAPDETVTVAGGGTAWPYQHYFDKPWDQLDDVSELSAARDSYNAVWVLYTFREYIERLQPELLGEILTTCQEMRAFPGTVSNGTIIVSRCTRT